MLVSPLLPLLLLSSAMQCKTVTAAASVGGYLLSCEAAGAVVLPVLHALMYVEYAGYLLLLCTGACCRLQARLQGLATILFRDQKRKFTAADINAAFCKQGPKQQHSNKDRRIACCLGRAQTSDKAGNTLSLLKRHYTRSMHQET